MVYVRDGLAKCSWKLVAFTEINNTAPDNLMKEDDNDPVYPQAKPEPLWKEQPVQFQMMFYCISGFVSQEQELPINLKPWESCFSLSGRCVEHTAAGWH